MTSLTNINGYAHVAKRYGLEEAIFLHSLMFWYRTNRGNDQNFRDGRWWTYNSIKAFEEVFPWWNAGQIRRIVSRCREKGALLVGEYNEDRRDRTSWYSPSDELLALYGESENCICQKQQMQSTNPSGSVDENGKCNIRKPCSNHVETDNTPYSPPGSPAAAPETSCRLPEDEDRHAASPNDRSGGLPAAQPKRTRRDKSKPTHDPEAFEKFWAAYPRRDHHLEAVMAWDRLKPNRELCRVMYEALKRQRRSEQWTKDDGQYIPLFSTWLNRKRWKDQGVDRSLLARPRTASDGWADGPGAAP